MVTEDVLSAIKVSRVDGVLGVAVLGSSLKEEQAVKIAKLGVPDLKIFLDNDNRQVRENQQKAKKIISPLIGGTCSVVEGSKDPKAYSTRELCILLEDRTEGRRY